MLHFIDDVVKIYIPLDYNVMINCFFSKLNKTDYFYVVFISLAYL